MAGIYTTRSRHRHNAAAREQASERRTLRERLEAETERRRVAENHVYMLRHFAKHVQIRHGVTCSYENGKSINCDCGASADRNDRDFVLVATEENR